MHPAADDRPRAPRRVACTLVLGAALAVLTAPAVVAQSPEPTSGADQADFGSAIGQIRGHLAAARGLGEAGDTLGAQTHTGHPIHEILPLVLGPLEDAGGDGAQLEEPLGAAAAAVEGDAAAFGAALDAAIAAADVAEGTVVGTAVTDPAYVGSVIARLLATAGHEYEEAWDEAAGISELVEFQDAWAFTQEAARQYALIAPGIQGSDPEEAAEITAAFDALGQALPGLQPPAEPVDEASVTQWAAAIGHELEETVGAIPVSQSDVAAEVATIESLLDRLLEEYRSGDAAAAAETAAEAYLEHYEVIEAQVIDQAPEINTELEPLLGAELRARINAGAPQEEIEGMVARAKELLAQALEVLQPSA